MRVADSSALYAFFVPEDEHHARARRAFEDEDPIWIPSEVVVETTRILRRRLGPAAERAAGEFLWSQANTEIQPSDTAILMAAWGIYESERGKLTFADSIVVATCLEHGAEPLAFDRHLLRAARRK